MGARTRVRSEYIQQALPYGEQANPAGRVKDRANEWLFGQRSERAFLHRANLGEHFVEHLPLLRDGVLFYAQELQVPDGRLTQLLRGAAEKDSAPDRPHGVKSEDQDQTERPCPMIEERRARQKHQCENDERVPDQSAATSVRCATKKLSR